MKHLLSKIFLWDEPAQGAFFGLIALFAWLWLVSMEMVCSEFIDSRLPEMFRIHSVCAYCLLGTILLLGLYFVGIRIVSLYRLCLKGKGFFHRYRYGVLLVTLEAHWLILGRLDLDEFVLPALLLHIAICIAMHPGAKRWERGSICQLLCAAAIGFGLVFAYSVYPFYVVIDKLSDGPEPIHYIPVLTEIRKGLSISGYGWSLVAFLAYLCVLLYCLLSGRIIARIGNVPKRSLFGRSVFAVLGLCVTTHVVFSLLALHEERNYRQVLLDLEGYFGKPLTISALEQEYYSGRKPEPDFWNNSRNPPNPFGKTGGPIYGSPTTTPLSRILFTRRTNGTRISALNGRSFSGSKRIRESSIPCWTATFRLRRAMSISGLFSGTTVILMTSR